MTTLKPTITKTTPELKVGDIVWAHCCRMELVEVMIDEARAEFNAKGSLDLALYHARNRPSEVARAMEDYERNRTVRNFRSKYLGPISPAHIPGIPEGWRKDWTIQGNHLAMWRVEVSP